MMVAQFTILDWFVLATYASGMLLIGWIYSRRNKTREDYLLGGRRMNATSVGISLFATLMSTLSYLTYPGELIQHGPVIFAGVCGFPLIYYVAGWWIIPRIMKMNVTSAYEILETRLGVSVRILATFMFLSLRLLWMATIIYVTVDVALLSVVSFDRSYAPLISLLLTIVTIIYTSMGGIRAVVLTDVIQSFIFLGGALLTILFASFQLDSFTAFFPSSWPEHWDTFKWGFDPQQRTTFGNAVLVLFVWYICTAGSDQMAIQRYLSTRDIKAARRTFGVSLISNLVAYVLLALVGFSLLAWFTANSDMLLGGMNLTEQADKLFPRFIMIALPPGLSGLVIAGLLAAAMSSLSSGLSSVSTVVAEDVIKRFRRSGEGVDPLKQVKRLSYGAGLVVILLSFFVGTVPGNLLDVLMRVVNLFVAPLFVLFFLALFVPFATERGTLIGGFASIGIAVAIAFYGMFGITVLWIMPTALVTGIVTGAVVSFLERMMAKASSYEL